MVAARRHIVASVLATKKTNLKRRWDVPYSIEAKYSEDTLDLADHIGRRCHFFGQEEPR